MGLLEIVGIVQFLRFDFLQFKISELFELSVKIHPESIR